MAPIKSPTKKAPQSQPLPSTASDVPLSLNGLLKYLTSGATSPLTMNQAIKAAAILVPKKLNSPAKLAQLNQVELNEIGLSDEAIRKGIVSLAAKAGATRAYKRAPRESDLDKPLPTSLTDQVTDTDFIFDEISHEGTLAQKSVLTNRAPVLTAWATIVAERLGFNRQEALSIASVFVSIHSAAARGADQQQLSEAQPFVDLLGRKVPMLSTQAGDWRAIHDGAKVSEPGTAFKYITKAFAQQTGATMGALRLLGESFPPAELNRKGLSLYHNFRPDVEGWGQKGEVHLTTILDLRRFITHNDELKPEEVAQGLIKLEPARGPDDDPLKSEDGPSRAEVKREEGEDEFDQLLEGDDEWDLSAVP